MNQEIGNKKYVRNHPDERWETFSSEQTWIAFVRQPANSIIQSNQWWCTVKYSKAQYISAVQYHTTIQYNTILQYSTIPHYTTVQFHTKLQHSSTLNYSTIQYSTVQYHNYSTGIMLHWMNSAFTKSCDDFYQPNSMFKLQLNFVIEKQCES